MIKGLRVLGLIPARGGSKGIPDKNIKPLSGKPLIQWTIDEAKQSKYIDRLVLSSDSEKIIRVARESGCEIPFVRPESLAKDESGSIEVVLHALGALNEKFDYLILLQPTSPFRTVQDIDGILEYAEGQKAEVVVSVTRLKKHPMFMYQIEYDKLQPILHQKTQLRRQDMPPAYEHNGALYVSRPEYLRKYQSFNRPEALAYVTEGAINLDIDTLEDWEYAEFLVSTGKCK